MVDGSIRECKVMRLYFGVLGYCMGMRELALTHPNCVDVPRQSVVGGSQCVC